MLIHHVKSMTGETMSKIIELGCCCLLVIACSFLMGCYVPASPGQRYEVSQTTEMPSKNTDLELITEIEKFSGSGDSSVSDEAWKRINSYPRQDVIDRLKRLYTSLPEDDHHRVLIAFVLCNLDEDYQTNKQVVLSSLTPKPYYKHFYGDWAAALLIRLIQRGDKSLLPHIFAAAEWSDGAMSEELSGFFVEEMKNEPEMFLSNLKAMPLRTRHKVYKLFDESVLSDEDQRNIKEYLISVPKNSATAQIAKEMLKALPASHHQ